LVLLAEQIGWPSRYLAAGLLTRDAAETRRNAVKRSASLSTRVDCCTILLARRWR